MPETVLYALIRRIREFGKHSEGGNVGKVPACSVVVFEKTYIDRVYIIRNSQLYVLIQRLAQSYAGSEIVCGAAGNVSYLRTALRRDAHKPVADLVEGSVSAHTNDTGVSFGVGSKLAGVTAVFRQNGIDVVIVA